MMLVLALNDGPLSIFNYHYNDSGMGNLGADISIGLKIERHFGFLIWQTVNLRGGNHLRDRVGTHTNTHQHTNTHTHTISIHHT